MNTLNNLYKTLETRKSADPNTSYTAQLIQSGEDEIIKKIGEEAIEIILAAKGQGDQRLVEEISDLTYHILVLLVQKGIPLSAISDELNKRKK
ncbi:MAG: phosphoribosyl-ATP diphosphatase [Chloroflexi bacterium HGW-Chloroflexi-3]|nr:MAG: phosphoribosyl-ATP diphosphatase [Chloroflexi bacterium HGW-Chloroflexi-3]